MQGSIRETASSGEKKRLFSKFSATNIPEIPQIFRKSYPLFTEPRRKIPRYYRQKTREMAISERLEYGANTDKTNYGISNKNGSRIFRFLRDTDVANISVDMTPRNKRKKHHNSKTLERHRHSRSKKSAFQTDMKKAKSDEEILNAVLQMDTPSKVKPAWSLKEICIRIDADESGCKDYYRRENN